MKFPPIEMPQECGCRPDMPEPCDYCALVKGGCEHDREKCGICLDCGINVAAEIGDAIEFAFGGNR